MTSILLPEPIPCQVVKITAEELEVRFPSGVSALKPGLLLRFEHAAAQAEESETTLLYGKIEALKVEPSGKNTSDKAVLAKVRIVLGEAMFCLDQAVPLSSHTLVQEVSRLMAPLEYPIALGQEFAVDFAQYNTLSVLSGPSLYEKLVALAHWLDGLCQYQRLVVIDPLGILEEELLPFMPEKMGSIIKAGGDASLSLQSVGIKRFLSVLSSMLPDVIRGDAIQLLAEVLPIGQNFVPFKELLRVETLTERNGDGPSRQALAMKTPLLNCLYEIDRQRVFADTPREVLSLNQAVRTPVTVIDLAGLGEPWKTLFYEEICFEILANAGGNLMPVFIYPENYLGDLPDYIKKLNEADISALALASPYFPSELQSLADNRMHWSAMGDLQLEGTLTFGLPIQLDLGFPPTNWLPSGENVPWALTARTADEDSAQEKSPQRATQFPSENFSPGDILSRAYAQPGMGNYQPDEDEAEAAHPLQARYRHHSPVAAPSPASHHLSSYNLDEHETHDLIEPQRPDDAETDATRDQDALDLYFKQSENSENDVDIDPKSETEQALEIFESSQWQETIKELAQKAGLPPPSMAQSNELEGGGSDETEFDSILGSLHTVRSQPGQEDTEAEYRPSSLASSMPLSPTYLQEVGGQIFLEQPEFISPEAIARSLATADKESQAPGDQQKPGPQDAQAQDTEPPEPLAENGDMQSEMAEQYLPPETQYTEAQYAENLQAETLPEEYLSPALAQPSLDTERDIASAFEDDFEFDLSLLPDTPLPEMAVSVPVEALVNKEAQMEEAQMPLAQSGWQVLKAIPEETSPEDIAPAHPQTDIPAPGDIPAEDETFSDLGDLDFDDFSDEDTLTAGETPEAPEATQNTASQETQSLEISANETPRNTIILDEPPPVRPKAFFETDQEETSHVTPQPGSQPDTEVLAKQANGSGSEEGFDVGERVVSDKYGEGTVQKLIPMEMTTAIHVLFDSGAKRTIVPTGNNLRPA